MALVQPADYMLPRNSHVGRNVGSADEDSRAATARIDRAARLGKGRIRPPRTSRGSGVIGYGSGVSLQFNKIFKLFSLKLYKIRVRFFWTRSLNFLVQNIRPFTIPTVVLRFASGSLGTAAPSSLPVLVFLFGC